MSARTTIPPDYLADMEWADTHVAELHRQYENQWVAIVGGRVVAAGVDLGEVEERAARATGKPGDHIYVEFVEEGAAVYGLHQA